MRRDGRSNSRSNRYTEPIHPNMGKFTMDYLEPIDFVRHLRQAATSSEENLWQLVRNRQRCGKKFRRQHPLGIYTADFYCVDAKLVLEIDGSPHQTIKGKRNDEPAIFGCAPRGLRC